MTSSDDSRQSGVSIYLRRSIVLVLFMLLSPFIISACNVSSSSEFSWGFWSRGGMRASVSGTRSGSEYKTARAKEGEELIIDYDIEVTSGKLVLSVSRPLLSGGQTVWSRQFEQDRSGQARVSIEQSGAYEIRVTEMRFGGRYDITWDTE